MNTGSSHHFFCGYSPLLRTFVRHLSGLLFFVLSVQLASAATPDAPVRQPLLGQEPTEVTPGVLHYKSSVSLSPEVWIYVPKDVPAEVQVPLVLIAASGSRGYHGADLQVEDQEEYLAYARHGMIVVAYSIPGSIYPGFSEKDRQQAIHEFHATGSGVRTARAVLNHVLYEFPQANRDLVFAAGINSAATVALNLAAYDDALAGVIAFAPSTDLQEEMGELPLRKLSESLPGLWSHVYISTPYRLTHRIDCPVFIFQSTDDRVMRPELTERFVTKLTTTNEEVTWIERKAGDHYESMLDGGISSAVAWIEQTSQWKGQVAGKADLSLVTGHRPQ